MAAAGVTSARGPFSTPDPAPGASTAGAGERSVRLKAIGQLSQILFADGVAINADERRRWLERWHAAAAAGARSEPLAAFFHAGQKDAVSDLTASWLNAPDPDERERAEKIFLLSGLRMENDAPLARWAWGDGDGDRGDRTTTLVETLQYFLSTGGQPTPQTVAQLFRPNSNRARSSGGWRARFLPTDVGIRRPLNSVSVRWPCRAATLLPRRTNSRSGNSRSGDPTPRGRSCGARSTRARARPTTTRRTTLSSRTCAAYYFLLPASERAAFATGYLQAMRTRGVGVAHAALATALLHALAGNEPAACRELDQVVDLRLLDGRQNAESTDLRRWNYAFACGTQLQAWNLDRLAAHVWRRALAGASAFDKNDEVVRNVLSEIRLHQLVAEVLTAADPQEARERMTDYLHERPSVIVMASAASVLMNVGQYPSATQIYEHLRREVPTETDYPRALLLAANAAGDPAAEDGVLAAMLDGSMPDGSLSNRFEIIARRAGLAENAGDPGRACRLLLAARREFPGTPGVLRPLAQTLERCQRPDDAAAIWREVLEYDHSTSWVNALASLELQRGHREEAFKLARDANDPTSEAEQAWWLGRRVSLYLATGHATEAVNLAWQAVHDGKTTGLTDAGAILAAQGQRPAARDVLAAAVRQTRDPAIRFQIQQALIKCAAMK